MKQADALDATKMSEIRTKILFTVFILIECVLTDKMREMKTMEGERKLCGNEKVPLVLSRKVLYSILFECFRPIFYTLNTKR